MELDPRSAAFVFETCTISPSGRTVREALAIDMQAMAKIAAEAVARFALEFESNTRRMESGCIEWVKSRFHNGYGQFPFRDSNFRAHRVAWVLSNGEIPDGKLVLHKCDNRACCNPDHLFVGTQRDNIQDCIRKGRFVGRTGSRMPGMPQIEYGIDPKFQRFGTSNGRAKISEDVAREIIDLFGSTQTPAREIAERTGASYFCVQDIICGRRWQHLPRPDGMPIVKRKPYRRKSPAS